MRLEWQLVVVGVDDSWRRASIVEPDEGEGEGEGDGDGDGEDESSKANHVLTTTTDDHTHSKVFQHSSPDGIASRLLPSINSNITSHLGSSSRLAVSSSSSDPSQSLSVGGGAHVT